MKRFELLKSRPELRERLWHNVRTLQNGLRERGFDLGDTNTCVTPVYMRGPLEETSMLVRDLRENYGIFCSVVIYPVVPRDMVILRLIPTAVHTDEDIRLTLEAFSAVREKLERGAYRNLIQSPT